ncbi:hypothetical protein KCP78_08195 [Salmonella enterica subsp. enterica]|nr:hypothetical protein KCP78_08195 [Salmonella enterica subsp. enterica]
MRVNTPTVNAFPGGRDKYRCFRLSPQARFARSAGEVAILPQAVGSDWRFTAGRQRDRFSGHPGVAYSAKSPRRASEDEVSAVLKCTCWRKRCNWADIIRLMFTVAAIRTAYPPRYEHYFAPKYTAKYSSCWRCKSA